MRRGRRRKGLNGERDRGTIFWEVYSRFTCFFVFWGYLVKLSFSFSFLLVLVQLERLLSHVYLTQNLVVKEKYNRLIHDFEFFLRRKCSWMGLAATQNTCNSRQVRAWTVQYSTVAKAFSSGKVKRDMEAIYLFF